MNEALTYQIIHLGLSRINDFCTMTQSYINIHTHRYQGSTHHLEFVNHSIGHEQYPILPSTISAGLHPWYITEETLSHQKVVLQTVAGQPKVKMIGECGLDRLCATEWSLQEQAFSFQIELANHLQKPLVIHCVKAYSEVLYHLKRQNNQVPVIFHGFNKNVNLALSLVEKGYYLSFGKALRQPAIQNTLRLLPLQQFFLETDDADLPIETVYDWARSTLSISLAELHERLHQNLHNINCNE